MKNILLIITTLSLVLTSCESFYGPQAKFDVSNNVVIPYQEIQFYNKSEYANDYEWSFGDGYGTNEASPVHFYTEPGVYEVKLSAFKDDQVSDAYITIEVIAPDLNILVEDYDIAGTVVVNAKVTLFQTFPDWFNNVNKVAYGYTNTKGEVEFFNLDEGFYYFRIESATYSNIGIGNSDVRYVTTPFVAGSATYMNALAEYIGQQNTKVKSAVVRTYRPYNPEMSIRKDKIK